MKSCPAPRMQQENTSLFLRNLYQQKKDEQSLNDNESVKVHLGRSIDAGRTHVAIHFWVSYNTAACYQVSLKSNYYAFHSINFPMSSIWFGQSPLTTALHGQTLGYHSLDLGNQWNYAVSAHRIIGNMWSTQDGAIHHTMGPQMGSRQAFLFMSFPFFSSKPLEKVPKPEAHEAPANGTRPYMSFRLTNFTRNPTIQLTAVALPDD